MRFSYLALPLLGVTVVACAQRPADVTTWKAVIHQQSAHHATLTLDVSIQPGWHIYAPSQAAGGPVAMTVKTLPGAPFQISGPLRQSQPARHHDANFDMDTDVYTGSASFSAPLQLAASAAPSASTVDVHFQVCSAATCLPPATLHLSAQVQPEK